ncbi:MAG: N-acetylmuramoyl-L-alanine amidase [Clostridiales bacterium]|nr:N-acetylmuramoyl-L-alanine amidase [Clostridiales bacterium]
MSNYPFVDFTQISPNRTSPRKNAVKKITIHHMAGMLTVEQCGAGFASPQRQASANYGVDADGRVGMYVEESDRAWTSSSAENDNQAVTIEAANDEMGGQWHVSDQTIEKLIALCVDICRRNGIERLNYTGDKTGNLTMHKMFAATACPGPYLESKFPYIAEQVNQRLEEGEPMTKEEKAAFDKLAAKVDILEKENKELTERLGKYDKMGVYENVAIKWAYNDGNLPSWARDTVKKLTDKGYLYGNDKNSLELSYLMLRLLVILDRAGSFGE